MRSVAGATIEALGVKLHREAIALLGLSDLSSQLLKRSTQAIIGRELFDAVPLQIDIRGGRILAVQRAASRPAGN